ncbi:hypothetical protein F511_06776 [Dorcoceras hygrometricum]|uniref:DEAD/DEAH-box helicase domain-containing protein n=1 Tax=Dorcoceras hygrometricum TaxID=472368 RepID=A0A2Z7D9P8_9LAMI|nr:hypothetical protein F511_06776 [Dorcoceras hygrometricum]
MGRSDDSISRRRNRKSRKRHEDKKDSSSKVSARVAAIIASKNRRKSGKRRLCQGMCFSLPTPEDPFNDNHGKIDHAEKRKRSSKANGKPGEKKARMLEKMAQCKDDSHVDHRKHEVSGGRLESVEPFTFMGPEIAINVGKPTCQIINRNKLNHVQKQNRLEYRTECPSKFLITCLNSIQTALEHGEGYVSEVDKPFFANAWGIAFWNCYSNRKDVLETDRADSTTEQIAWIASTAADTISMKEKMGLSFTSPFLLYIVPSREKASKVREVCKPLKTLGIHTVSVHSGASIDHQVNGLKSCEPEFIVSTPDRLLELLNLKAFDTSGVSLLVIDGLEYPSNGAYFDAVKSIRQLISGNPQIVVFCDCLKNPSASVVQKLTKNPSSNDLFGVKGRPLKGTHTL